MDQMVFNLPLYVQILQQKFSVFCCQLEILEANVFVNCACELRGGREIQHEKANYKLVNK